MHLLLRDDRRYNRVGFVILVTKVFQLLAKVPKNDALDGVSG